ncbi:hypothetical protein MC885_008501 [Smutsia gigantea]|nr:hypothetical protein MC885_008501 [Smutsia gigantea]
MGVLQTAERRPLSLWFPLSNKQLDRWWIPGQQEAVQNTQQLNTNQLLQMNTGIGEHFLKDGEMAHKTVGHGYLCPRFENSQFFHGCGTLPVQLT